MIAAPLPFNESLRLNDLYSYNLLDTEAERDYDQLVELASLICQCETSAITLIDKDRQWFKARKGLSVPQTPREEAMCAHAILQDEVFIVENALEDERFHDLPSVLEDPAIRFYAGAPITSAKGFNLGTVCVVDSRPRQLSAYQIEALQKLARQASILFEFRKKNEELKRIAEEQMELKNQAEAATRTQKQFLSTVSHEIRTPLNGIIGMTNLLLLEDPAPHQLEYLNSLKFASGSLLNIVNDVLDYTKITSSLFHLEKVSFNLFSLLQDITSTHALAARAKGILFNLETDSTVPRWVKGDSTRLTQVLNNLIGNAVKFTTKGGVRVKFRLDEASPQSVAVKFEISDTGIGIEEERIEAIFEQFTQANGSINRHFGGTGLGLAITKKLLELQGSQIWVKSKLGEGSCFYFTLTLERGQEPLMQREAGAETPDFSGVKVLIVEDNKLNWVVLSKYLSAWNMETELAENGSIALQKVAEAEYDLVFMDLQMPVMDGFIAARKMREEKLFEGPIIAITADAFAGQDYNLEDFGFTDSVMKPFERADLYSKMRKLSLLKKA